MHNISEELLSSIRKSEALRLNAYLCPANVWTVGYGSTFNYNHNRPVRRGDVITANDAELFLREEIKSKILPQMVKIPCWGRLNNNQKDVLIDFAYNLGAYFYNNSGFETISACLRNFSTNIVPIPRTILNIPHRILLQADLTPLNAIDLRTGEQLVPYALLLYRNPGTHFEQGLLNRRINDSKLWRKGIGRVESFSITAVTDTFLKKSTVQASDLKEDQIVEVVMGRKYVVDQELEEINGHKHIRLAYGAGDWYVFKPHWDKWKIDASPIKPCPLPKSANEVNWSSMNTKFGPYFTLGEYYLRDNRRIAQSVSVRNNSFKILSELHKVREAWGHPLRITSGYRPIPINRAIGSFDNSRHVIGDAVDIADARGEAATLELQRWLDSRWGGALGYGASWRGFVHLDMRNNLGFYPNGAPTRSERWNY